MITKSNFIDYCKCPKLYYLKKEKVIEVEERDADKINKDNGMLVGELARGYFGDYKLVQKDSLDKMVEQTDEFIKSSVETICEASFIYKDLFCAVDILHKNEDGYDIYEVKSTNELKEIHQDDVSFQYYVLTNAGYNIKNVYVLMLNEDYIFNDKLDLQNYLIPVLVTPREVKEEELDNIRKLNSEGPTVGCEECTKCSFFKYCYKHLPEDNVFNLVKLQKKYDYYNHGIITYDQVLPELDEGKETHKKAKEQINYYQNDLGIKLEKGKVEEFLSNITYPIYYLDFETIRDVVPFINGTWPNFTRIVQYSLHVQESIDSELKHYEYLQESKYDNIDEVVNRLINDLGTNGSIIVYSSFERGKIEALKELRPDKASELDVILNRLVDLEIPFKNRNIYCKEMEGRSSIKKVLPALCKGFEKAYEELPLIHKGDGAMAGYLKLISTKGQEHEDLKYALLEYCKLDTLSMVKVSERIYELVRD